MSADPCDRQHKGRELLSYPAALALLAREVQTLARPAEPVPLLAALGRVLRAPVALDRDEPPVARSAMDGYAVRSADGGAPRRLAGTVYAGTAESVPVGPGEAVAVMTGGTLAPGADAVVPVELTQPAGGLVQVQAAPKPGQNVRRAGEMGAAGRVLLQPGRVLTAADLSAAAGCGADPLPVAPRPRVAILSSGDEVVAWTQQPQPHQVRDSNRLAAALQAQRAGGEVVASRRVPDHLEELRAALAGALERADLIVTIGGVSMGEKDLLPQAFAALDVEELLHGVSVQPGKPVWVGRRGDQWVLGLPGNPVSAYVILELFGVPMLRRLAGAAQELPRALEAGRAGGPARAGGRERFLAADLRVSAAGEVVVTARPEAGSGDWTCLALAEALLHVPADTRLQAGDPVRFLRLS
ncbi:MAG: molybdopterin molybdenumtransferase MoeA [Planctomycetota bacterium]|nr:MAG: molybdopterin molybdenumtransferase MoeA [Planctomycetota bacterium]